MIHLPAGTQKYLLLDNEEIQRNSSRRGDGAPAVVVVEFTEEGGLPTVHYGYRLLTDGPVHVDHRPVPLKVRVRSARDLTIRASYSTTGAVALSENPDEVLVAPPTKPSKSTKGN